MAITRVAPAKINIYLKVTGKRAADGYHDIETVFLPLPDLSDTVTLSRAAAGITLSCDQSTVPLDQANLCWRAASSWATRSGIAPAWHIHLEKRIPIAAGLGGGSSDAGATLLALQEMYDYPLSDAVLHELAVGLGADVAFFLTAQPAAATGIGEVLQPLVLGTELAVLVVNPRFPVTAAWAYAQWRPLASPSAGPGLAEVGRALAAGDLAAIAAGVHNDLQFAVRWKFPLLDLIADCLTSHGCLVSCVSGSGPTLFGICPPAAQQHIAHAVTAQFGASLAVYACRMGPS